MIEQVTAEKLSRDLKEEGIFSNKKREKTKAFRAKMITALIFPQNKTSESVSKKLINR